MTQTPGEPQRIVVVGGGAGGLELAIRLARLTRPGRRARVTLVDRRPAHIWKPRYHEIAAGLLMADEEEAGYAAQAARHGFAFALGAVTALDLDAREVRIAAVPFPADDAVAQRRGGELLPARSLPYDVAVLAIGSTINDFGTPGVREHGYTLDTSADAQRLHRAFLALAARVQAGVQPRMRVAIVGAGTTGVELAAELRDAVGRLSQFRSLIDADRLDITIFEMGDRPLPSAAPDLSAYARDLLAAHAVDMHFGAKVDRVEADGVTLEGGATHPADIVVWASGVKAERLAHPLAGVTHGSAGRVRVDAMLRVTGEDGAPLPGVYALGDFAEQAGADGKPLGATAQVAHQQARHLARSLARQTRGRPALPFHYHDRGTLVSLGGDQAVGKLPAPGEAHGLRIEGATAKLAYAGLYLGHLVDLFGWRHTAALAAASALRRSTQPAVKLSW